MEFKQEGIISSVKRHSLAEEAEIRPGEHLCAINGQPVRDLLDVSFAAADTEVVLTIRGIDGAAGREGGKRDRRRSGPVL